MSQPKPDSKAYSDLINEINKGKIKIPKFQRDFVWSIDKTAKLLDSILKGYPIGTFILWETNQRLNDIRNIGDFDLVPAPDGEKIQYVLDGQQRITSLYAAFKGASIQKEGEKKITDYRSIYIDLNAEDDDQIICNEKKEEGNYISLNKVLNFTDYVVDIKENFDDLNFKKIHKYHLSFSSYQFSTVVLRKNDISSAIDVFTRINTGGQTLTLFEIMAAKTFDDEKGFDMQEKFKILLNELGKYNNISNSIILSLLSLILSDNKECKRKTILELNKDDIIETWDDAITAIKESIDYMRSAYKIPVSSLMPYDSLLVPFGYFFYIKKDRPSGNQTKYLQEFFWRVSLSKRYSSATESKLAQDIKRIELIINNEKPEYNDIQVHLSLENLIETQFSAGSSFCKAILCLMASQEPKSFQDNTKIILDNSWLKNANSKNYHHFFPKAYLKKNNIGNENSIVNITLVSDRLNKRKIGAKSPAVYIEEFSEINENLKKTIKSHLIEDINSFGVLSNDYPVFLQERGKTIYNALKQKLELINDDVVSEDDPIKDLILIGENEKVEFKSSLRFDMRTAELNRKLEFVVVKTIAGFLNKGNGTLIVGVDDDGDILGLEKDYSTIKDKPNKDGFELILRGLIKKYFGHKYDSHLTIEFKNIENKEICVINIISKSSESVFVNHEGQEKFFVRIGNSTQPLSPSDQSRYERGDQGFLSDII